jgi:hypothetical protein
VCLATAAFACLVERLGMFHRSLSSSAQAQADDPVITVTTAVITGCPLSRMGAKIALAQRERV